MDAGQNLTKVDDGIDYKAIEDSMFVLTPQQQVWIDYKAVSGFVYEDDKFRKMTVGELATKLNVSRETLYAWRNQIPNFWERVSERRKELGSTEWLVKMHEQWKLHALKFDNWQVSEAWLINFDPSYTAPKLKVQHELGDGVADALNIARERRMKSQTVVEAVAVDDNANTD
jgi:hypothetical protein